MTCQAQYQIKDEIRRLESFLLRQGEISDLLAKITLHSIHIIAAVPLFKANATNLVVMGRL